MVKMRKATVSPELTRDEWKYDWRYIVYADRLVEMKSFNPICLKFVRLLDINLGRLIICPNNWNLLEVFVFDAMTMKLMAE